MPSVGAYLRQLRETRGVSLEEIARVTRVSSSYLHALEGDDFASLPVPVFTRGFVRAYCQALGEAPDEALTLYEGRSEAPVVPITTSRFTSVQASAPPARTVSKNRGPVLVSFVLLVVLAAALFAVTLVLQSGRETPEERRAARATMPPPASVPAPAPERQAATPAPVVPSTPPAVAPTASAPIGAPVSTPPVAAPQSGGYRLVARAVEPTWIRVRTEEGRTTEETIPAGQMREWFSTRPFTVTVGNAGGISLELNGRALPPLGPSGAVIPRLVLPTESP